MNRDTLKMLNIYKKAAKISDETPNCGNKNLSAGRLETNIWEVQKTLMKLLTAVVCGDCDLSLVTGGDASFQSFVVMEQVAVWASGYRI